MPNSRVHRGSASLRSSAPAAPGLETLEPRQLLSGELPSGSEYIDWGRDRVAVNRGAYILTFDEQLGEDAAQLLAREAATRLGVPLTEVRSIARGHYALIQTNSQITRDASRRLLAEMPLLSGFEPDMLHKTTAVPNDTRFGEQYALENTGQPSGGLPPGTAGADISAVDAWNITTGSRSVVIAVIDTGVDSDHPDLAANMWQNPGEIAGNFIDDDGNGFVDDVNGFDFGEFDSNPDDIVDGHGTLVAGCIGAVGNNNLGVAGVAWQVSIMSLKIANAQGGLSTAAIVAAHDYATLMRQRGINLVASNNSYGAFAPAFFEDEAQDFVAQREAIERFIASGGTFVAAAGNNGADNDDPIRAFPASFSLPGVISVAATDNNDALANFSNYGAQNVDIAAPGVQVLTTAEGGGYAAVNGTSFASPIVAGAVALIKTIKPNASAVEIREALINSADPHPSLQGRTRSGGRLNVAEALRVIGISGPVVRAVTPGPVVGQLDPLTNQPLNKAVIAFSQDMQAAASWSSAPSLVAQLTGAGVDDVFGTGDDVNIPITSVTLSGTDPRTATVNFNLSGFVQQRLPIDLYRLTLFASEFRDTDGDFLNGNSVAGVNEVYNFRVAANTGDNEPNDTLAQATPTVFDSSGVANFNGVTLGNGLFSNLDVDLYRIDMVRGGLITAEVTASRLPAPSSLDSYLRLFNAAGQEIAFNDQFFGDDSFIDFFVTTGGTYYVGVSGFGNAAYNPTAGGSGATQSTGVYNVRLQVQLQNDDVVQYTSAADSVPNQPAFPRPIPAGAPTQTQGTTIAQITVADTREILDLNVSLSITHPFTGDLRISLIAPDNVTTVLLVNRRGGSGDNFTGTVFDDEATGAITSGFAPFTGTFRPEVALGFFDGLRGNGVWTLLIQDQAALNPGTLDSWGLTFTFQNNIFGPFESNDTINTAKVLNEITGTGSATREAFIGDGGFGGFDRDIFRFEAVAGSSLTAVVVAEGTFNSILRLFDSSGAQILLSNPSDSRNSRVDNFVFATGGTYYLAVSEGANPAYNPSVAGSGNIAVTTGNYTLTVNLAAGVSDPAQALVGNDVSVGMNTGGVLSGPQGEGLIFNGIEFIPAQIAFLGVIASGYNFSNTASTTQQPFSLVNSSDAFNNRVSASTTFRGLKIERTLSYAISDNFIAIDLYFTNTTASTITGVGWMEGFNPDPGDTLGDGDARTRNDVDASGRVVSARYINNQFTSGLTVALAVAASETRAKATVVDEFTTVRDPDQLIDAPINDPDGAITNGQLAMSFDIGNLAAGARATARYFIFMGNTPAEVDSMYAQVNAGTGTGHLTANPATPATEALDTGGAPASVPTLPYKLYYPEGFYGDNIFTFLPISNLSDQAARIVVIARYEFSDRDHLVGDFVLPARSRDGLTINTPDLFGTGQILPDRPGVPYTLEVRSDRPVTAMFSHYDVGLLGGVNAGLGESFTSQVANTWTFGRVVKNANTRDFITFYNTTSETASLLASFYPVGGGAPYNIAFVTNRGDRDNPDFSDGFDGFRRGGFDVFAEAIPEGEYGVVISSTQPIVASLSRFLINGQQSTASGVIGVPGNGSATGVLPEGQFGLNGTAENIGVLNVSGTSATVVFSFLFTNGSAYRTSLTVPNGTNRSLDVSTLPNFPSDRAYSVFYESNTPVAVTAESAITFTSDQGVTVSDGFAASLATQAQSLWAFGEGFRPGDVTDPNHPGVIERLRLYNPANTDVTVEITIDYFGSQPETFRRTLPARRLSEFDIDQFITGDRRNSLVYYGISVKAPTPIVAAMDHYDLAFQGGFSTLGTPLGRRTAVT